MRVCFAGGLCKFHPTPEENDQYSANHSYIAIQAASQSTLSMHNFIPLVISGKDKNKQLTLLTQRKLAFTGKMSLYIRRDIQKNVKPGASFIPACTILYISIH
jgi:hypothetical protein